MKTKIIRYFVQPSRSNKTKWIITSVALNDHGEEYSTALIHGVGTKRWMKELAKQLTAELAFKD